MSWDWHHWFAGHVQSGMLLFEIKLIFHLFLFTWPLPIKVPWRFPPMISGAPFSHLKMVNSIYVLLLIEYNFFVVPNNLALLFLRSTNFSTAKYSHPFVPVEDSFLVVQCSYGLSTMTASIFSNCIDYKNGLLEVGFYYNLLHIS